MTETERYDIVVFGGGKAGKTLAMDQAKAGKKVALVEVGMIGGSCINVACIPTKTLVRSAQVADTVRHSEPFGTDVTGVTTDMVRVAARTASVVAEMVDFHLRAFHASGLELILGWGRFVEPRVIEVETDGGIRRVTAERIYLNLGTVAAIPPVPGLAEAAPMTHVEALKLETRPARLLILGGGYIGMEMAQAFRRLGSEIVVLEAGPQLAAREDTDVASSIQALFQEAGIELAFDARDAVVTGRSGDHVTVQLGDGRHFRGTHLLVAVGRRPMTEGIGLGIAGVTLDAKGFILVDETLRTSAPGVWAMGEVAGTPMFTHASLDDYRVAKSGITGGNRTTTGRLIPVLRLHRPRIRQSWPGRARGTPGRHSLPTGEACHGRRAASAHSVRAQRFHESPCRGRRRSYLGFCHAWGARWRGHGGRSDGHAR